MGKFNGTRANGRPKGISNKLTAQVKESFAELIEGNLSKMQKDLDSLKPLERLKIILELSGYIIPKCKSVEIKPTEEIQINPVEITFFKTKEE